MSSSVYSTAEEYQSPVLQYIGRERCWWKPRAFRKRLYRLAVDYYFEWGPLEARKRLYMQAGFEFDRASIPRLFGLSSLLGFDVDAENDGPSMFHDRMCRDRGEWTPGEFEFQTWTDGQWKLDSSRWRSGEVHDFFGYFCRVAGMSAARAEVQEAAVRAWLLNGYGR